MNLVKQIHPLSLYNNKSHPANLSYLKINLTRYQLVISNHKLPILFYLKIYSL
ncbi:hypothetical protein F5613_001509 [Macellibacteroides fermentans]|uniref:Uncharacterized protein n=1 Tax=Macellibacteroides fermentans TaxID=879969 RepID=A0A8E2D3V5_9PORP|nr:hypothetical protein [Macellibacteroides fermentans]